MNNTVSLSQKIDQYFFKDPVVHPEDLWLYTLQYKWLLNKRDNQHRKFIPPWRLSSSGESSFRQNGYAKKDLKKSLNRDRKTREYRHNDKTPCAWPIGGKARQYAQIEDNRTARREARRLIKQGRYEEVPTQEDPVNTWKWD